MALELSNTAKTKCLNNVFRPATLYVMTPTVDGAQPSDVLPSAEISFNPWAVGGQISLAAPVQLAIQAGTTIDKVYLHTSTLTEGTKYNALVRIDLTGDDVEVYDNNGVYIINTINVSINT